MLVLWERDWLGVGELRDRLDLDSGTLSPLLRRRERAGLVRRERAPSDERRVTIHLTGRGRDLQERAAGIPEAIAGFVVDDEAGYEAMKAQLNDLVARIALSRVDGSGGGGLGHEQGPHHTYAIPTARRTRLGTFVTGIRTDPTVCLGYSIRPTLATAFGAVLPLVPRP